MVISRLCYMLGALSLYSLTSISLAQELDPNRWYQEYLRQIPNKTEEQTGSYPKNVVFIERFNGKKLPKVKSLNPRVFNKIGFLDTTNTRFIRYYFKLNTPPESIEKKNPFRHNDHAKWAFSIGNASHSQLVVAMTGESWEGFQIKAKTAEKIFDTPIKSDQSKLIDNLVKAIGYDAIILDQRGDSYLVGTLTQQKKVGEQALVFQNSHDKMALEKPKGDGLLELKAIGAGLGIYKIIVEGSRGAHLPPGTKLGTEAAK